MNKLLFPLSVVLIITTFNSCSPDEDEAEQQSINAQNQMKTIRMELISEVPIGDNSNPSYTSDIMYLTSSGGVSTLNSTVPNQFGQNTITQTFTAAPSSNLFYYITRLNYFVDSNDGSYNCTCGEITLNIYANDILFHTVTKELGGVDKTVNSVGCPCPDGSMYNSTVIVPQ